jgi:hypothetical protein
MCVCVRRKQGVAFGVPVNFGSEVDFNSGVSLLRLEINGALLIDAGACKPVGLFDIVHIGPVPLADELREPVPVEALADRRKSDKLACVRVR